MAREDPQFRIRLPAELKARIEDRAAKEHRSLNAEIVRMLEMALRTLDEWDRHEEVSAELKELGKSLREDEARDAERVSQLDADISDTDLMAIISRRVRAGRSKS